MRKEGASHEKTVETKSAIHHAAGGAAQIAGLPGAEQGGASGARPRSRALQPRRQRQWARPVTYAQFRAYGIDKEAIAPATRELRALGLIEITQRGRAGNADFRRPNFFRLTFLPTSGAAPTNEWAKIDSLKDAETIAAYARADKNIFDPENPGQSGISGSIRKNAISTPEKPVRNTSVFDPKKPVRKSNSSTNSRPGKTGSLSRYLAISIPAQSPEADSDPELGSEG